LNSAYALRAIVDIRTEDEITFELPYLIQSDYIKNDVASGRIDILVLNDLRGPESVAQNIDVQVFYRAGDDFEYAVPTNFFGRFNCLHSTKQ